MDKHPGLGEALPQNDSIQYPPPHTPPVIAATVSSGAVNHSGHQPATQGYSVPYQTYKEAHNQAAALPAATVIDTLFALFLLVMGFCFWNWQIVTDTRTIGVGATLFFWLLLGVTSIYLHKKGVKQTKASSALLGLAVVAALPFALFGAQATDAIILFFEGCLCLLWLAVSCKTLIVNKITGLMAFDMLSQTLITPFANFGQLFVRGIKGLGKKKAWVQVLIALAGVLVSLPIILIVVSLLMSSDDGFRFFMLDIQKALVFEDIATYGLHVILGIPVACYIFGAAIGNAFKHYAPFFGRENLDSSFVQLHVIPRVALYGMLILLVAIYLLYFIAMGSYLYSGFLGDLPQSYTHAEYARQGFFELCWVAVINFCVLGITWLFAKRNKEERPALLRILTACITALTGILVIVAASKMWLYIEAYGLTRLRVCTSWFMLVLFVVCIIVLLWHLKPFNLARPVFIVTVTLVLALSFVNIDGLIARFNVEQYTSGQTDEVDTRALAELSDAAVPALRDMRDQATNPQTRESAERALAVFEDRHLNPAGEIEPWQDWFNANMTSYLVWKES